MPSNVKADTADFIHFTGKARLSRDLSMLEGLLKGIAADAPTPTAEVLHLWAWLDEHKGVSKLHPFNEICPKLQAALEDDDLTPEEVADIRFVISQIERPAYYDSITGDVQELHGLLTGVVADGKVTITEMQAVRDWCHEHEHLATVWPFDEIQAIAHEVLKDGVIDEREHAIVMAYFRDYAGNEKRAAAMPLSEFGGKIQGLCTVAPDIAFPSKLFCFTGSSPKATRKNLAGIVEAKGGRFANAVSQLTDYLIIGSDGNPCWAFACYGRKVEQVIHNRRGGARTIIVHEVDFWDAAN